MFKKVSGHNSTELASCSRCSVREAWASVEKNMADMMDMVGLSSKW